MDSTYTLFRSKPPHIHNLFPPKPNYPINVSASLSIPTCCFAQRSTAAPDGRLEEAVLAVESGATLESGAYIGLLQSCIDADAIAVGRRLHAAIGSVKDANPFVETKLVSMYAKCGSLEEARKVFDEMPERNLFAWSAMIGGCARERRWRDVVELFYRMMWDGMMPDGYLLPKILQACGNLEDVVTGKVVHSVATRCGALGPSAGGHVVNSVLGMYAKCGELGNARWYFEKMERKDPVSWNSMISGYCQHGKDEEALRLFDQMQDGGTEPSLITWNILIASCNESGNADRAMEMVKRMQQSGLVPDVFTWTSMISGFVHNNRTVQALELLREMLLVGVEPNGMTFVGALSACTSLKALGKGKELHSLSVRLGYSDTILVGNALIDLYAKCGRLEDAECVFRLLPERDVFTWNSMIGGYTQSGYCGKAYDLFSKMENMGVRRNVVTWNAMISGYMQNGDEDQAMDLFQRMAAEGVERSAASWNLLIAGWLHSGNRNEALRVFRQMQSHIEKLNSITILCVLPACANLLSAQIVKEIHACVLRRGLQSDLSISNSLIDTYAKSGDVLSAQTLFDRGPSRDSITWNSLISGYLLHKRPQMALDLFYQMKHGEAKPNQTTLASVISAYGLMGMVDEANDLFSSMEVDYGILIGQEHYIAMVDVFGRSGRLSEAMDFIEKMPVTPDSAIWSTLLDASRIYGNKKMAHHAAERLVELEPRNFIVQYLLIQIQALCRCNDASKLLLKLQKGWKVDENLGHSWIGHSKRVLTFSAGAKSFTETKLVYDMLDAVTEEIKMKKFDLLQNRYLDIEDDVSETVTGLHSEKLAIAFALVNPPARGSIRIVKNLRTCLKCHTAAKYISLAYQCEIMLKDPKCLHHFRDGQCSCGDYW